MIKLKNINKSYNSQLVLENINLHIEKNDIFGIIGKSGAGKSTLIRLINRLEEPDSGSIYIKDTDITNLSNQKLNNFRKKIGMIFQNFNLLNNKTVAENILLPLKINKTLNSNSTTILQKLIQTVELTGKENSYPSQLSGGQKQRVAIARCLITSPDIILCDEATASLDSETTSNILQLLQQINTLNHITIILITHELQVIETICNKVAVLHNKKILEQNTTYNIFTNPQENFTKTLINQKYQESKIKLDTINNKSFFKIIINNPQKQLEIFNFLANNSTVFNIISSKQATLNNKIFQEAIVSLSFISEHHKNITLTNPNYKNHFSLQEV
jgi:D-methionine transport system ATP-binding protein